MEAREARLGARRARRGGARAEPRRGAGFWPLAGLQGGRNGLGESPAEPTGFGKQGPVAVELPGPAGRALPACLPGRWGKQLDGQVAGLGFQRRLDFEGLKEAAGRTAGPQVLRGTSAGAAGHV